MAHVVMPMPNEVWSPCLAGLLLLSLRQGQGNVRGAEAEFLEGPRHGDRRPWSEGRRRDERIIAILASFVFDVNATDAQRPLGVLCLREH